MQKIYLAGPEVFLANALEVGNAHKLLCKKYGYEGLFPLDNIITRNNPKEIAEAIAPQFKETNLNTIETIVSRYYEQDTWKDNLIFEEKSFELLQKEILKNVQ